MQKEFGEQLVACGLVGAAMEIFEEMELWDNLLICYRLLEKIPQALALVQKRLEVGGLLQQSVVHLMQQHN